MEDGDLLVSGGVQVSHDKKRTVLEHEHKQLLFIAKRVAVKVVNSNHKQKEEYKTWDFYMR